MRYWNNVITAAEGTTRHCCHMEHNLFTKGVILKVVAYLDSGKQSSSVFLYLPAMSSHLCTLVMGENFSLTSVTVRSLLLEVKSFYSTHLVHMKFKSLTPLTTHTFMCFLRFNSFDSCLDDQCTENHKAWKRHLQRSQILPLPQIHGV